MVDYGPETYGDRWAEIYDEWVGGLRPDADATADRLAELAAGGRAFVPDLSRFDRGQRVETTVTEVGVSHLHVSLHDPVTQRIKTNHVVITEEGIRLFPVQLRYAFPSELDLMARLAGLRLRDRWGGWGREPFGASSGAHVSVYERAR